jgi:hypothetical protein
MNWEAITPFSCSLGITAHIPSSSPRFGNLCLAHFGTVDPKNEQPGDQAAQNRIFWPLQALISRIWPSFFLCCWLGDFKPRFRRDFYPTDLLYARPRLPAPELRLQHLHRNRHFGLAWDYSGYIGPAKWAMSISKVRRSRVNTIRPSPLAENQSFNGYLAPAARTSQQLQNDYMKHFAARGGF